MKIFNVVKNRISNVRIEILKDSSPFLVGLFTIVFGIFATETIQRSMNQLFPSGVLLLYEEGLIKFSWRIISLLVCAFSLCVFFVHSSLTTIRMRLYNPLVIIYLKVFYIFYLSLSPWVSLHLARLCASVLLPDIDKRVDVIFICLYGAGLIVFKLFLLILEKLFTEK